MKQFPFFTVATPAVLKETAKASEPQMALYTGYGL